MAARDAPILGTAQKCKIASTCTLSNFPRAARKLLFVSIEERRPLCSNVIGFLLPPLVNLSTRCKLVGRPQIGRLQTRRCMATSSQTGQQWKCRNCDKRSWWPTQLPTMSKRVQIHAHRSPCLVLGTIPLKLLASESFYNLSCGYPLKSEA
jgi:hypothetical protein